MKIFTKYFTRVWWMTIFEDQKTGGVIMGKDDYDGLVKIIKELKDDVYELKKKVSNLEVLVGVG